MEQVILLVNEAWIMEHGMETWHGDMAWSMETWHGMKTCVLFRVLYDVIVYISKSFGFNRY